MYSDQCQFCRSTSDWALMKPGAQYQRSGVGWAEFVTGELENMTQQTPTASYCLRCAYAGGLHAEAVDDQSSLKRLFPRLNFGAT